MGLLSPIVVLGHPIPWLRPDHPLQHNLFFHAALKTGFCGALTTFASWNTQMVVMLDGTDTELGPQVAPALFGYIIGVCCAVSSFVFGRHVYGWWRCIHPTPVPESLNAGVIETEERRFVSTKEHVRPGKAAWWGKFSVLFGIRVSPFLLLAGLIASFAVGDAYYGNLFYRKMWLTSVMAPFGAILRWRLSELNARPGFWKRLEWVPWGTFAANMIGAVISVVAEACEEKYDDPNEPGHAWLSTVLPAIELGFAGSLSTVSTFVKEIVEMKSPLQMFIYTWGSLVLAMLLGLLFYSPIVRS